MHSYLSHLLSDIAYATDNVSWPFIKEAVDWQDWISPEEEEQTAPVRNLEEWTGIKQEQLPPANLLSDEQIVALLDALKKMLDAYNWSFVLQINVPERIQYETIRSNFNQSAKVKPVAHGIF
jgi:hypothetical protein